MPTPRLLPGLASCAALAMVSSGCAAFSDESPSASGASAEGRPSVVAAFYPLQWVTQQVAGDPATSGIEVTSLTQPGGEPHDLELGPRQTAEITEADLVVYLGEFQAAVDDSVEANAGGATLDVADAADLLAVDESAEEHEEHSHDEGHSEDDHDHDDEGHSEEGHDHDHGDEDPHFWHDPARMADVADEVATQLGEIDSENADSYTANAEALRQQLEGLDTEFEEGLAGCERDTVVVSHDAFSYLDRYGLEFESINGLSPGAEPTPADLARLQDLIDDEGITTVFSERLVSPRLAESLARDAGVETAVLDPLEGLSDETADEDYLSLMRANLEALAQANGCQ